MQEGATEAQIDSVIERLVKWGSPCIAPPGLCTPYSAAWGRSIVSILPISRCSTE